MIRVLISFFFLFTFSSSVLDCGVQAFLKGNKSSCSPSFEVGCKQAGKDASSDNHGSEQTHHCHISCTHTAVVIAKPISIWPVTFAQDTFVRFAFHYIGPYLDSIERPPLAA